MEKILLLVLLTAGGLNCFRIVEKPGVNDYWAERARILMEEENSMLGGDLKFEGKERLANEVLMSAKRKEIDDGIIDPASFLPSQNFLTVANKIRESPIFKIIEELPKGAVLHAHDTAITSAEYIFWNITFRPNLYACEVDGLLKFHFFDKPDQECNWKLLEDLRKNDPHRVIDTRIARQLSMVTKFPEQVYPDGDKAWEKFVQIFLFITPMLTYRPVYEDHFYRGLLELYHDNVLYLELRSTLPPLYDLDGKQYSAVDLAHIYKEVSDKFVKNYPDFMGMKLIYAPHRKCSQQELDQFLATARQLKKELPNFVVGFDLVGQEDKGYPLIEFADKLRAISDDVHLFFHAGETNWYGTSIDKNLIDAVMLNTKRIGHGYALVKHPKVLELARQKKIAIEIAPISNQVLDLVRDLRNHPASVLFSQNYPVVISNDDPGLWGAQGLSYDFYEAFVGIMSRDADLRSLKKLALNSIEYSSLTEQEKKRALEIWRQRWDEFIDDLATGM